MYKLFILCNVHVKMSQTRCHRQDVTDKMSQTSCHWHNVTDTMSLPQSFAIRKFWSKHFETKVQKSMQWRLPSVCQIPLHHIRQRSQMEVKKNERSVKSRKVLMPAVWPDIEIENCPNCSKCCKSNFQLKNDLSLIAQVLPFILGYFWRKICYEGH